jgi:DNA-binding Lrp family transcriptional regulator
MTAATTLPRHLRPRREKIYGDAPGIPLDRNAKARIMAYARGWNAKHKQPGQHRGPITRATEEVLAALLWGFHNSKDGRCFPSYEAIAERARCSRDTVYEAIRILERAEVLTWVNRIVRTRVRELDLFGKLAWVAKIIRTSNAYSFRDPLPCHAPRSDHSKSENPAGTLNQDISSTYDRPKAAQPPLSPELDAVFVKLGNAMAARAEKETQRNAPSGA